VPDVETSHLSGYDLFLKFTLACMYLGGVVDFISSHSWVVSLRGSDTLKCDWLFGRTCYRMLEHPGIFCLYRIFFIPIQFLFFLYVGISFLLFCEA